MRERDNELVIQMLQNPNNNLRLHLLLLFFLQQPDPLRLSRLAKAN